MPAASVGRAEPEAPVAGVVPAVAAGRAVEAATAGKAVAASQRALTDPLTDRCHPTRHGVGLTAADKIDHLPRTTP